MAETRFEIGELIENRYRVLSVIGTGGMGTLYRVSDEAGHGEIVALKTLRSDAPAPEMPGRVECFRREFKLLTQLHHPNLVDVYHYGVTADGELYFTMEWIEGKDLDPGARPLEPAATVPVIVQICRALAYLHARGVIHGDLKPSNILMTGRAGDQVKLVDFGVALEVGTSTARAQYYTPGYTAPEVRRLQPVDFRADLYSLGALWYALLVGEPPTFMPGAERLIRLTVQDVLQGQERGLAGIGALIPRLLKQSPQERYGSANEVIEAVNEATGSTYALETRETASSYALRGRFVGREAEMQVLQALWQQAQSGEGKLVLVGGEAGVGKTRLVEELVIQAELEGARAAHGQCVESGGIAYRPWREILRVLVRYVEGANGADQRMAHLGPVLATLLPELWERDYAPPAELEPHAAQQRLNDAIAQVLRATASSRPTAVVIEDAHWADEATLELLRFLARVPELRGLLICVTYRADEIGPKHALASIESARVQRVPLQPLPTETTTDLVCSMLGLGELPAPLTERVQQTTRGNAFFIQELVRSLAEDGVVLQRTVEGWQVDDTALREARLPESIHQAVERRWRHLSTVARQALQWAAIVGSLFWDGVVEEISGIRGSLLRAALSEGLERGLIFERDTSALAGEREFLFAKPAVQEVSYESISEEERRAAHGQVAAWLMARRDEETEELLGLIADHLEKAGQMQQAVTYLRRAGEQAAAQFANAEAIAYLTRALDLIPEGDLAERYAILLAREQVYDVQGAREDQARDLASLKDLAETLGDDRRRTAVALRQACYCEGIGDYPASIAAAQEAIRLAQATQDVGGQAEGHWRWGYALWRQAALEEAQPQLEQALALARAAGARQVEAESLNDLSVVADMRGDSTQARVYCEEALRIRREIGDRMGESVVLNNLSIIAGGQGNKDESKALIEQALRICREIGDRRGESRALGNLGSYAAEPGDYTKAMVFEEQALHIRREIDDREGECIGLSNLGYIFRNLGQYAKAREYAERSLRISDEIGERRVKSGTLSDLGLLFHYLGDDEATLEYCHQALSIARETGVRQNEAFALTTLGHALAGLGRLSQAAESYRQAQALWRESGQHSLAMTPLAGLARVSLIEGDLAEAQARVEEILRHLEANTLEGSDEPFRIYLICYHVLRANQDPRADDVLSTAHRLLQEQASRISDKELRRSFLEDVPAHQEIVSEQANRRAND